MINTETMEGYLVDIACLRKYPAQHLLQHAKVHSRNCTLMGHCVESGYGLVNEHGVHLLDTHATPMVLKAVSGSTKDQGIRLLVRRELLDGEMQTVQVEESD